MQYLSPEMKIEVVEDDDIITLSIDGNAPEEGGSVGESNVPEGGWVSGQN